MYKLDLGPAIAMAPDCYKNFLAAHKDRFFEGRIFRPVVNEILLEHGLQVVLRRKRLKNPQTVFSIAKLRSELSYKGDWYLEFKSKRDYTAFVLKWG